MNVDYVIVCYEKINEDKYTTIIRDNDDGVALFLFRQHEYPEPKCHQRVCYEEVKVSKNKCVTTRQLLTPRGSNLTHAYILIRRTRVIIKHFAWP